MSLKGDKHELVQSEWTSPEDDSTKDGFTQEFTEREQRSIIHKIDRRLISLVGLMYCVSLMDRTNLSNAAIAGMTKELKLNVGYRYSIVTLVFFPTYVIFQIPSTVIVRKIGPRIHLGTITLVWGGLMIAMGFVKQWKELMGLRILLGILEAGFFPSCVYLLSTWYSRFDMGRRYSMFYILGCVASAFSGVLAYGLMQLNGRAGLGGWRWIFILEGVLTCVLGVIGFLFLVGFPEDAAKDWKFLTPREVKWVIDRVNADRGDAHTERFTLAKYLKGAADLKVWAFAMIFCCTTTVSYALAYFLPIILKEQLHFSIAKAQCLGAPPYVFAGIVMYATGYTGDKMRIRGPIITFNMILCLAGLPFLGWVKSANWKYFGIFLITAGANANIPAVMTYQANNVRGHWKRAFCSATLVGFGGIGGIAGGLVFREQDKPHYRPGIYACMAACIINIIIVALLTVKFKRDNLRADRGEITIEDSEEGFRYTY
ncbi:MFS general substrate transporter [Trichodelitschia bisporula]|uniref:MFS general substrate transporter n=1 Tax=Trichodelitschia bisporula TaxID=703511 RepID=A0A6G1I139_9PEZI|nr:MFS general substrate transporter [Trichodelitschia bisporula]